MSRSNEQQFFQPIANRSVIVHKYDMSKDQIDRVTRERIEKDRVVNLFIEANLIFFLRPDKMEFIP